MPVKGSKDGPTTIRGEPHEDDSGWRLTEGSEDEAYMEDISNARLVVAGALIDRDLSLAAVFRGEFGEDCRRNGIDKPWHACDAD